MTCECDLKVQERMKQTLKIKDLILISPRTKQKIKYKITTYSDFKYTVVIINGNIVLKFNKDIIIFNSNNYKQRILRYQLNQICEQYCLGIKIVLEHCMWYVQYETKKYIGRYPFIDNMRILRNKV